MGTLQMAAVRTSVVENEPLAQTRSISNDVKDYRINLSANSDRTMVKNKRKINHRNDTEQTFSWNSLCATLGKRFFGE